MDDQQGRVRLRIETLRQTAKVAFSLAIAERLLANYPVFSSAEGFGDPSKLRDALDLAWSWLADSESVVDLDDAVKHSEAQAPDPGESNSLLVSAALDAVNAVLCVLELVANPGSTAALEASELATDTVDLFVQEVGGMDSRDPDLESRILSHPLMQAEHARQASDLNWLTRHSTQGRSERSGVLLLSGVWGSWKAIDNRLGVAGAQWRSRFRDGRAATMARPRAVVRLARKSELLRELCARRGASLGLSAPDRKAHSTGITMRGPATRARR